jgi:hypothetical protein
MVQSTAQPKPLTVLFLNKGLDHDKRNKRNQHSDIPRLSIDAWGNPEDGYEWNQWFNVGSIDLDLDAANHDIIRAMVNAGYLTAGP